MSDTYPIRAVEQSELEAFSEPGYRAFNSSWPKKDLLALDRMVFEPERTLAAFDGDQIVGTTIAYSFDLTIPGGMLPAGGVSAVAVLPSHRRRGILTAMMSRQLSDLRDRGEPVAALFASEAAIYGRFGYGSAVPSQRYAVNCQTARVRSGPGTLPAITVARADAVTSAHGGGAVGPVTIRTAEPKAALAEMAAVYEAIRPGRPGMISRSSAWWELAVSDLDFVRDGKSPLRCVLADGRSGPRGYALYATKSRWDEDGQPTGVIVVHELFGADSETVAALWADLLSRDLVSTAHAARRPADDPLPFLLTDPREVRARVSDGLWVRLVDLQRALSARHYLRPVDVVIEVGDDLLPANAGRWRLRAAGPAGPSSAADRGEVICERTTAEPDIALDVSALGAAYLGGTRLSALAAAGLVAEGTPGAVAGLSAAMSWDPAPWSPIMF